MQPGDLPITRTADPIALACAFAEEDPVPPDPAVLAEMDAALHDDKPGIAFDQVKRELGL